MGTAEGNPNPPAVWLFVNDIRLVIGFLGTAMVIFGVGMLLMMALGADGVEGADFLLGLGVFIVLFAVLLLVPRLRSRGAMSYSLVVPGPMDLVADAVREAVGASGRKAQIELLKARFEVPPRTVHVEGVTWHFTLKDAPYRRTHGDHSPWTELVQAGLDSEGDEIARELRERVASLLTTSTPSAG